MLKVNMPIYDLECKECGTVDEFLSPMMHSCFGDHIRRCRNCGSTNLERLYTGSPIIKMGGYPRWVDKVDDYQKRQEDRGITPTLPHPSQIL